MSEVISVHEESLSKSQWGKSNVVYQFFFEVTCQKDTLRTKRVVLILMGIWFFLIVLMLLTDKGARKIYGDSLIASPSDASFSNEIPQGDLLEITRVTHQAAKGFIHFSAPQVFDRPRDLQRIPPGSLIRAKLVTGASNGLVRAESLEALKVNGDTIIERGAVFLGSGNSGEDRLNIGFNQVVFRDGTFSQINAFACDESDKIVGLKGSRVGSRALNIAGGIGLGFLGGFSQALQDRQGQQGAIVTAPSMKNALLNGTSTAALEQSKSLISEMKDKPNVFEVSSGTSICILFGENR